ncbi:MAG TPA: ABC transporter permease [Rubricoccaceae bacterium]|nr:ABC transporter permease [Rubricoccaceae bacterium]
MASIFANGTAALLDRPARAIASIGRYWLLLLRAFNVPRDLKPRLYLQNLMVQMVRTGVESIPIVALATAFTGGVTAVQALYQLENPLLPLSLVGTFSEQAMVLELGTLVTAFVLSGRVGARIAAELGTMRVTEQIDAMEAMGVNSLSYLVVPRVLAGVLMFPALYVISVVVGLTTSALVAQASGKLTMAFFWEGARDPFRPYDVFFGLVKSVTFGFAITSVSCYMGYYTRGGAEGVGVSTTMAAVMSCVLVLLADYLCAAILL